MNVDVAVNGRPWKVAIKEGGHPGRVAVVVKGQPRVVDAVWIDSDTLSLIDRAAVYHVRFHRGANDAIGVEIQGRMFNAVVSSAHAQPKLDPAAERSGGYGNHDQTQVSESGAGKNASDALSGMGSSHAVKAPMPGRVVGVLVAVGDHVASRQPVVVVEAMKMENELRASRAGTVTEVKVAKGAAVEAGTVLVVIADS
jgi:biotin carboxyl carrier protein